MYFLVYQSTLHFNNFMNFVYNTVMTKPLSSLEKLKTFLAKITHEFRFQTRLKKKLLDTIHLIFRQYYNTYIMVRNIND